jgi:hypothetical protein
VSRYSTDPHAETDELDPLDERTEFLRLDQQGRDGSELTPELGSWLDRAAVNWPYVFLVGVGLFSGLIYLAVVSVLLATIYGI